MIACAGSSGETQVQYLEELEGWVLDERKVVTFRWLALVLSVTANAAKKMLYDFCEKQGEQKVSSTYLVMGRGRDERGAGPMEIKLVPAKALDETRKSLVEITSVHVYSVQPASASEPMDLSAQLWATDSEHSKEMVAGSTDAGASLRSHRLSGVRCAEIVDEPLPTAPAPPDNFQEESVFDLPGGAHKGASATTTALGMHKPKGKTIAPKDFFASTTTGGGKGKGKANHVKEEMEGGGEGVNKPAPRGEKGGIGSFFGKAAAVPPSKKANRVKKEIEVTASDVNIAKREKGSLKGKDVINVKEPPSRSPPTRSPPTAKSKKSLGNGELRETCEEESAGVKGRTKTNGPSAKSKKPRLSKLAKKDEEDEEMDGESGRVVQKQEGELKKPRLSKLALEKDEGDEEVGGGIGRVFQKLEGWEKAGGDSSDEEEWNGEESDDAGAGSRKKTVVVAAKKMKGNGGSSRAPTLGESSKSMECNEDASKKGGEHSTSPNGTTPAPPVKKSRKSGASAKNGSEDDDESPAGRSKRKTKAIATSGAGGEAKCGKDEDEDSKPRRSKGKASVSVKRKGRYDSGDEEPDPKEKAPVSGAIDKFTARAGGAEGGATKRTKVVLKTKTYMDGGYMKRVNEEVEVTDDEEEPLKPAHTNKAHTLPLDGKSVKNGVEKKVGGLDAPGGKGSGKTKKAGRVKAVGKQSNMMSFFKKA